MPPVGDPACHLAAVDEGAELGVGLHAPAGYEDAVRSLARVADVDRGAAEDLRAHGRLDAVGGDEHVGQDGERRAAVGGHGEARPLKGVDADDGVAEVEADAAGAAGVVQGGGEVGAVAGAVGEAVARADVVEADVGELVSGDAVWGEVSGRRRREAPDAPRMLVARMGVAAAAMASQQPRRARTRARLGANWMPAPTKPRPGACS